MDPIHLLTHLPLPWLSRCRVPTELESVLSVGEEARPREAGVAAGAVERVWRSVEDLYRTGVYPAVQVCIRCRGHVLLNRALGHASGNAPTDPPDAPKVLATPETPICLFSASKAITSMLVHKLDERRVLHLDDRVAEYLPDFVGKGKKWITIRHLLAHRAGIPSIPPEALDLDLLSRPQEIVGILSRLPLQSRPGLLTAYHAVSGGFVLGEIVRAATGSDVAKVLEKELSEPLGFRWMRYGVHPRDVDRVAVNAMTGPPVLPPFAQLLRRALGVSFQKAVEISNDPRFLTGVVPAANVIATAQEACAFYQCLLEGGELDGARVFDPRTVRHATVEQSYREVDLTLGVPLRYGVGVMLGDSPVGLFGPNAEDAYGHLGFTNIFTWADPERDLAVALLTTGKPFISLHFVRVVQFLVEVNRAFPKRRPRGRKRSRPARRRG